MPEKETQADSSRNNVLRAYNAPAPQSSKDPVKVLVFIATHPELSDEEKQSLIVIAQDRFANRRKMAIWSMKTILASFLFLFAAALIDSLVLHDIDNGILAAVRKSQNLFISIEAFLLGVVATYYGAASLRPTS